MTTFYYAQDVMSNPNTVYGASNTTNNVGQNGSVQQPNTQQRSSIYPPLPQENQETIQQPIYQVSAQDLFRNLESQEQRLPTATVTEQMRNETNQLLRKASQIASTVISSSENRVQNNAQVGGGAPVYIDLSQRNYNILSSHTETHYHNNERPRNEDDKGLRVFAVMVGVVVTGIAAYFFGKAVAENEDGQDENADFGTLKQRWVSNKTSYVIDDQQNYCDHVDTIIHKADVILERQKVHRIHKIALTALFLFAGGAAIVGGIMGSGLLMSTALVTGIAGGIFALYKLGYHCFSKREEKEGRAIQSELSAINFSNHLNRV